MPQKDSKTLDNLSDKEQKILKEFLEDIQKGRHDPVHFAEKLLGIFLHDGQKMWIWVTTKTQKEKAYTLAQKLKLYETDKRFVTWEVFTEFWESNTFKRNILVPGNRFGKTFITGVKHMWRNYYKIGVGGDTETIQKAQYETLNLASHSAQATAMPKMMKNILQSQFVFQYEGKFQTNICQIPEFLPTDGVVESPNWVFKFANGSKFISRTSGDDRAGAVQGTFFYYISYDECSRSYKLEEEIEPDILPRLIDTNGPLDLLSTPDKGSPSLQYYYELCEMGKEGVGGWYTQEGKTSQNIFISKENHEAAANSITDPDTKKQVLEGNFVFSGGRMFSGYAIKKIWDKDIIWEYLPLTLLVVDKLLGKPYNPSHKYITGNDFARSESGDATVSYTIDISCNPYEIVSGYRVQGIPIMTQMADLTAIKNYYNSRMIIDRNGLGGRIIEDLLAGCRPEGFDFKGKEKGDMLFILKNVISQGKLKAPLPTMENTLYYLRRELGSYKEEDTKLKTDTVMSLGMAVYPAEVAPPARITPIKLFRPLQFNQ